MEHCREKPTKIWMEPTGKIYQVRGKFHPKISWELFTIFQVHPIPDIGKGQSISEPPLHGSMNSIVCQL